MTGSPDADVAQAFEIHDAFEALDARTFRVGTTTFEGVIEVPGGDAGEYRVTVETPSLQAATRDDVGPAVRDGWFETFEARLAEAPSAVRADVDLTTFDVLLRDGTVRVTYGYSLADPALAARVGKAFVEYVEGTYVEGVIPGYEYLDPVATLLGAASSDDDGERGGTPL